LRSAPLESRFLRFGRFGEGNQHHFVSIISVCIPIHIPPQVALIPTEVGHGSGSCGAGFLRRWGNQPDRLPQERVVRAFLAARVLRGRCSYSKPSFRFVTSAFPLPLT